MADTTMEEVDGSSSDELSDFDDIDISEEDMNSITELEKALADNPNLYEKHIEYISLLRKAKMKTKLRTARQAMHARFPLSAELWIQWLDDEHDSKTGFDFLDKLYTLATEDYLSVDIWEKYLKFLSAHKGSSVGVEGKLIDACEAAVLVAGLHVVHGHRLWELYRDIAAGLKGPTSSQTQEEVFFRQLQVPLDANEEALQHSGKKLGQLPEDVQKGYQKAQTMLTARRDLEASFGPSRPADTDLLAAYMAYIKLEEASKEVARVRCLYERALARFPVTHFLWQQYAQYLEHHQQDHTVIKKVYARAVRNCPWIGQLWARSLRAIERGGASNEQHQELFNAALSAGMETPEDYMQIFLARLDYLRRGGESTLDELWQQFSSANDFMQTYFPDYVDRVFRLPGYWATCLWELIGDHDTAKQVWEAALDSKLGMVAEAVLAYVAFELSAKRFKEARSIFRNYHRKQMYGRGGVMIAHSWLRFERERGSADDLLQAFIKTEPVLSEAASYDTAQANPQLAAQTDEAAAKVPKPKLTKAEQKALRQEKDPNFGKAKEKNQPKEKKQQKGKKAKKQNQAEKEAAPVPGEVVGAQPDATQVTEPPVEPDTTAKAQERAPKRKKEGLGFEKESKRSKTDPAAASQSQFASAGEQDLTAPQTSASVPVIVPSKTAQKDNKTAQVDIAPVTDNPSQGQLGPEAPPAQAMAPPAPTASQAAAGGDPPASGQLPNQFRRTAFIKSIAARSTEEDIRNLMAPHGRIVSFKMPINPKTKSHRGFAYVIFASPESLQAALAANGVALHGHELKIAAASEEVPEEARTAFVLNLPLTATESEVRQLFALCGPIVSIRLPLERESSQPRGFAYVTFETREGLQNAVDMTGVELSDKSLQIKVADIKGGGPGPGRGGFPGPGRGPGTGGFPGRGGGGGRGGFNTRGRGGGRAGGGRDNFNTDQRGRVGPNEPPGGGGRGVRPRMDFESNAVPRFAPQGASSAPKSNADFSAMVKKK